MRTPPIDWEDLHALGVAQGSTISGSQTGYVVDPHPPRLVRQLLSQLAARPAPDDDRMAYLRHVRDLLMTISDYTQSNDSPLNESQKSAWAAYRQSLRDLPNAYSGEGPIPWPTAPE